MERTLPHDLGCEKSILGAILVGGSKSFNLAIEMLSPDDFFRDAHRRIYAAMVTLGDRNEPIDLLTLKAELDRRGELEEVGGPAYIAALTDGVPRSSNIGAYATVVRECAIRRVLIRTANEALAGAYDTGITVGEVLSSVDRKFIDLQRGHRAGEFVRLGDTVSEVMAELEHREANRGQITGVPSGFKSVDEITNGWQAGDLVVLAARPSIGKTAFVLNIAEAASRHGKHVVVFSLEMKRRQLQSRLLAHLSGVPHDKIRSGYLSDGEYAALSRAMVQFHDLNIHINDRSGQSVWDVRSACRRMKSEHKCDLVVIDYVQLMSGSSERRGGTRNEEISEISRRLKVMADEINAPVIVLSQLSRAADSRADKRPLLSDLRDSGALEQDADIVAFLHRAKHTDAGVTQFIVEKQRNGATGVIQLTLDRETQTFYDKGPEPEPFEAAPPEEEAWVPPTPRKNAWRARPAR